MTNNVVMTKVFLLCAFYFNAVVSPTDPQVHLAGIVTN